MVAASFTIESAISAPVVILKLDDLRATTAPGGFSAAWSRLFTYAESKPLTLSVGIICNSLESSNPDYIASIRQIHTAGRVEFWNHGYLHVRDQPPGTSEFKGTGLEYQRMNFQAGQRLARERLGFPFHTFGAPFNQVDAITRQVLEEDPEMQTWFFGLNSSRIMSLSRWLNLEVATGVLDYDTFVAAYPAQRQRPYLVLQGHPGAWDEANFITFTRIVDFLISDGVSFMTPSSYRAGLDTDLDGVPDVIEVILGRNPSVAESAPAIAFDPLAASLTFEIASTQPAKPQLTLDFSSDLKAWTILPITTSFITALPDGRRRIQVPVSHDSPATFWRLRHSPGAGDFWP